MNALPVLESRNRWDHVGDVDAITRATTVVQVAVGERPGPAARSHDCVVVIYTREPELIGKRFMLEFWPVCVGRSPSNQIVLPGPTVSRRHARFLRRDGCWWVVDVDSTNGTYVNGEKIDRRTMLANGDRLQLGATILMYLSGAGVEAQNR